MSSLFSSNTTYGPIYRLLNVEDEKERDRLTERWRDHKLQELNFVGIVVSQPVSAEPLPLPPRSAPQSTYANPLPRSPLQGGLLANVMTSTNSWPNVFQPGNSKPWPVRACWFSGLVFALAAVLTAASQSIRLHRLSCRTDAHEAIRGLLASTARGRQGEVLPRQSHVYLWQTSVMYLMVSVFILLAGLFCMLWAAAGGENWWNGQAQLAITFTVVAGVVIAHFVWEQLTLFSWDGVTAFGGGVRL